MLPRLTWWKHRARQISFAIAFLPVVAAAAVWRRTVLRRATVIAVTGSVGKTTAKEGLVAILQRVGPTLALASGSNGRKGIPRLLLRGRSHHRFVVVEVGILKPGRMWRAALVVKPDVTIITHVNWQHSSNYRSLDEVAEQKAVLLSRLGSSGLAVLNADDERVAAMASGRGCRVRTFGLATSADVRAESVSAQWPDTLSFVVREREQECTVHTRLVGAHWVPSILAAITAARALGAGWNDCTAAIKQLPPYPARLSQLRLPNGAEMLRDEYNGSFATFERALEILRTARCERRVIAIRHIQDTPQFGDQGPEEVARCCATTADLLLCCGSYNWRYREAALAAGAAAENVICFDTMGELADCLRRETKAGDLILLKGTWFDHMSRVAWAQFGTVDCQREVCSVTTICDSCRYLGFEPDMSIDSNLIEPLYEGQARIGMK